ncbi:MAG: anti-sigma factor family protein, partial [Chthoniobacterales bacterium]
MNCEQIAGLLPDYLQGSLAREQAAQVEQHCEHCATCAQDVAMWSKLALLPDEQPSADSRARFEAMLHSYRNPATSSDRTASAQPAPAPGRRNAASSFFDWLRSPLGAVAWSAALLIVGLVIGTRVNHNPTAAHPDEI